MLYNLTNSALHCWPITDPWGFGENPPVHPELSTFWTRTHFSFTFSLPERLREAASPIIILISTRDHTIMIILMAFLPKSFLDSFRFKNDALSILSNWKFQLASEIPIYSTNWFANLRLLNSSNSLRWTHGSLCGLIWFLSKLLSLAVNWVVSLQTFQFRPPLYLV